jgi:class 3 adenylate cyclase
MGDIVAWLEQIGLAKYGEAFRENAIDFDVLPELDEDELKELGLPLGDRKRLLRAIAELNETAANRSQVTRTASISPSAERRQLTVLFVDLVGSTALSQRLDPEDLREVIRGYNETVARTIRDGGGFVAKFMGDGVLAYFGYPQATEDAAERAVRTTLRVIVAIKALPTVGERPLAVRAGVATGPVVVGDIVGDDIAREVNVVGETPNLAARLLTVAEPNEVVIADSTRRLVGDLFRLRSLGSRFLKGIDAPTEIWAVLDDRSVVSRFEAVRNTRRSQFVGRGQEVGLLLDRWDHAMASEGQLVLLSGEAGIGKSRITDTFYALIASKPHYRIRYQCSPQHPNSPLYPVITQLTHEAGIAPDDDGTKRAAKIDALLGSTDKDRAALIANVIGIPMPEGSRLAALEPTRRRRATLDALARQIELLCSERPVLLLVEDAHWIDPSTQDLVTLLIERTAALPLLIVVTFRPEYQAPWLTNPVATELTLNRLSRAQVLMLLGSLAQGKSLPEDIIDHITARSDGIPLYVEEMFSALRDAGVITETEGGYHLTRPLHETTVPATLQDSLMARLDCIASAKAVAQAGAAIGREFDHKLLAAAADIDDAVLQRGLLNLVAAGLVFARGTPPDALYSFKHALVRDAAYAGMLRSTRQQLHGRIALQLENAPTDVSASQPEILAHHFGEAGQRAKAAHYWQAAGRRALERSAYREAVTNLTRAIGLIDAVNEQDRARTELDLQIALAIALHAVKGQAAEEVAKAYERARSLCAEVDDVAQRCRVLMGLYRYFGGRGQKQAASELVDQFFAVAQQSQDPALLLQAYMAKGTAELINGNLVDSLAHLDEAIARYSAEKYRDDVVRFSLDPGVVSLSRSSWVLWLLGFPDKAIARSEATLELARRLGHTHSLGMALGFAAMLYQFRREPGEVEPLAKEAEVLCLEHGPPQYVFLGQFLRGWVVAHDGNTETGLRQMRDAFGEYRRMGLALDLDWYLGTMADVHRIRGESDEGMRLLSDAQAVPDPGVGYFQSELERLRGQFNLLGGDEPSAASCFERAAKIARSQHAQAFELRAAIDRSRVLAQRGSRGEARTVLLPVYDRFTEGFDTQDLKDAKALLAELT